MWAEPGGKAWSNEEVDNDPLNFKLKLQTITCMYLLPPLSSPKALNDTVGSAGVCSFASHHHMSMKCPLSPSVKGSQR